MMHSVGENKRKPVTWAFKTTTSLCWKAVTEQKVAQKQAGEKKREREKKEREKALSSCIRGSFYCWSQAFHPRQDISDAYQGPWCDLCWHIKGRPPCSTCIPWSFHPWLLPRKQNKLWDWKRRLVWNPNLKAQTWKAWAVCAFGVGACVQAQTMWHKEHQAHQMQETDSFVRC